MELCWVYPWSLLGGAWATPEQPRALLSPLSVLGLLLVGALATQLVLRMFGPRRIGQVVLVALGVVCIALAVRVDQFPASSGIDWIDQLVRDVARLLGQSHGAGACDGAGHVPVVARRRHRQQRR